MFLLWLAAAAAATLEVPGAEAVRIYAPTNGSVYLQPTNVPLTIQISVSVTNDFNAATDIYDGTNFLGSTNLREHHLLTWSNVAFGEHALQAVHYASTGTATSSVVRLRVDYGGWAMLPPGSVWLYRDGGVDLGTNWYGTNVDESFWPQGPAKLGFGDADVVTQVDYRNPDGSVYPTYYFRRSFTVPDPSIHSNIAVRLLRDDGAIVYLNGEELFRDHMPTGEVDYLTYSLGQAPDETEFVQWWMNPARLLPGRNQLAVEIHNSGPYSEDIGFDLALVTDIPVPPPQLEIQRAAAHVLVSWPLGYTGYQLESATVLSPAASGWQRCTNVPATVQGRLLQTHTVDSPMRFFRLGLE